MKYICCVWLCIVWLVCHAQHHSVMGLHVQQAPEIIQRITRQATRYGGGGVGVSGSNYRPVAGPSANYNLRTSIADSSNGLTSSQLNSISNNPGQRTVGVGAYSFGGMASGRPSNGNSFAVNTANLGKVGNSIIKGGIGTGVIRSQPPTQAIIGSGTVAGSGGARPQQLQQALLQAAQYQFQQQQLRRQIPQQQLYRQRPAPSTYQQYN